MSGIQNLCREVAFFRDGASSAPIHHTNVTFFLEAHTFTMNAVKLKAQPRASPDLAGPQAEVAVGAMEGLR